MTLDIELAQNKHADTVDEVELSAGPNSELRTRLDEYIVDNSVAIAGQCGVVRVEHTAEIVRSAHVEIGRRSHITTRLVKPQAFVARERPEDDLC